MIRCIRYKKEWQHDCDQCVYLGSVIGGSRMVDLYVCRPFSEHPDILARYGNDGPEYLSGMYGQYEGPSIEKEGHGIGHAELYVCDLLAEQHIRLTKLREEQMREE